PRGGGDPSRRERTRARRDHAERGAVELSRRYRVVQRAPRDRAARDRAPAVAMGAVENALDAIDRWQPVTNAFSKVFRDAVDVEPSDGPLAGVPVAVKDLFDVEGHETTGCCAAYRGNVARRDAE